MADPFSVLTVLDAIGQTAFLHVQTLNQVSSGSDIPNEDIRSLSFELQFTLGLSAYLQASFRCLQASNSTAAQEALESLQQPTGLFEHVVNQIENAFLDPGLCWDSARENRQSMKLYRRRIVLGKLCEDLQIVKIDLHTILNRFMTEAAYSLEGTQETHGHTTSMESPPQPSQPVVIVNNIINLPGNAGSGYLADPIPQQPLEQQAHQGEIYSGPDGPNEVEQSPFLPEPTSEQQFDWDGIESGPNEPNELSQCLFLSQQASEQQSDQGEVEPGPNEHDELERFTPSSELLETILTHFPWPPPEWASLDLDPAEVCKLHTLDFTNNRIVWFFKEQRLLGDRYREASRKLHDCTGDGKRKSLRRLCLRIKLLLIEHRLDDDIKMGELEQTDYEKALEYGCKWYSNISYCLLNEPGYDVLKELEIFRHLRMELFSRLAEVCGGIVMGMWSAA
jgi:hypothetical protein